MKDNLKNREPQEQKRYMAPFEPCERDFLGGLNSLVPGPGSTCREGMVVFWQTYSGKWERFARECECKKAWRQGASSYRLALAAK